MTELLGGKGAHLAQMVKLGVRVPPGFTISSRMCTAYFNAGRRRPAALDEQIDAALKRLEQATDARFGDAARPLLVSVRSGAAISMPGMMDTVLNIGLNDETVVGFAQRTHNERLAFDSYRRLLHMFGDVVVGVSHSLFESSLDALKQSRGVQFDTDLGAGDLRAIVEQYKQLIADHTGSPFPMNPREQLLLAVDAVFDS